MFASRHGEFTRTLSILDTLTRDQETSPADFTLSVHHSLTGLLSIARENRHGHTTIAGGCESFGLGMLEALACLSENPDQPVMVVYFDEPLPDPFGSFSDGDEETVAIALELNVKGSGTAFTLTYEPAFNASAPGHAGPFLQLLTTDARQAEVTGEQFHWRWERIDEAA